MTIDQISPAATSRSARVAELMSTMTLEEKLAQLVGLWLLDDAHGGDVAPLQDAMQGTPGSFDHFARHGLGQITRWFGTKPLEPEAGAAELTRHQEWLVANTKHKIPALVHEECLTGLAAWKATTYPAPLAWGASFDPELVTEMGVAIGESMRSLGVHQGLAPVLDVIRDARWGRVEECIAEDPYLVATIATGYVKGVQSTGTIATLKHFVGYSNSRGGRNLAPVHAGPREVADVLLFPFEMAIFEGGVGSVMNSYAEIDGVPVAADTSLLTGVLHDQWGFDGTVVADYFSVAFLHTLHGVAADMKEAAMQAISAGIDVELPTGVAYLEPLAQAVREGKISESIIDRALLRVLNQKAALGLLDEDYSPVVEGPIDLDPPASRDLARKLAEESVVLLQNNGALPLAPESKIAVIGPNADNPIGMFGCYAFATHVLPRNPGYELGITVPTVLDALRDELGADRLTFAEGCDIDTDDETRIAEAVAAAEASDVAVVVVGDRAGLFGRGTSGEGCDTDTLELPGVQRQLVEAVAATGKPVILVLLTGRAYALEFALPITASIVQVFFPGQEGGSAVAGVLSGRVNPSGRLPMSITKSAGTQPYSYLHPILGAASSVTNLDTRPTFSFGHGLSYTKFGYDNLQVDETQVPTNGAIRASVTVRNEGERSGAEVVQLYGHDLVASVTRPVIQLLGYSRVELAPGESVEVTFDVPTRLLAFSDRTMTKIIEPGEVDLIIARSVADPLLETKIELTGDVHQVTTADRRVTEVTVAR